MLYISIFLLHIYALVKKTALNVHDKHFTMTLVNGITVNVNGITVKLS